MAEPRHDSYDVIIVGGAIIGSSIAWFLTDEGFDGRVLVVERDPTYETSATSHTNSCMRQQFSNELNIAMSQFAADFVRNFGSYMGDDPEIPELATQFYGYLYLADTEAFAETLRTNQLLQVAHGAETKIMSPEEILVRYPFYNLDGIILGSHNLRDEGYFDSGTMFDWWRKQARQRGVEYLANEVVDVERSGNTITGAKLKSGQTLACGTLVNAAGPRAARIAEMVGVDLPVEPRRRYTFVFDAQEPLDRDLPLTIDPSGVHVRSDGSSYLAGCPPDDDLAVDHDDFAMDHDIWEEKVWPALARRIPAFERIKLLNKWVGHYSYNTFDQNVIVGPHTTVSNLVFANGFSGHGLQQAPAIGRGVAELITTGAYQTLDLDPLGYWRLEVNERFIETAII
ncbi:MAG: FAD-binding oxidoreductase [Acidimicrobiia bacterium]|nr:FAD-binding oxidoreductase [Acidimicrobiia bacterium]